MEVHTHSSPAPGGAHTARKKWTHYLWEFFMLFLAVTAGFFVENQREHIIEAKREKQYIVSQIRDVEMDIESLKQASLSREKSIIYFDSLVLLLKQKNKSSLNDIYFYARFLLRITQFNYHDRTIAQLKSSGSLRLIRNKKAGDSITIYDNEVIPRIIYQQALELQFRNNIVMNNNGKIFNPQVWNEMVDETGAISPPTENPDLITNDPTIINDFIMQVVTLKTAYRVANRVIKTSIKSAENLITYLKKEYHLE